MMLYPNPLIKLGKLHSGSLVHAHGIRIPELAAGQVASGQMHSILTSPS